MIRGATADDDDALKTPEESRSEDGWRWSHAQRVLDSMGHSPQYLRLLEDLGKHRRWSL